MPQVLDSELFLYVDNTCLICTGKDIEAIEDQLNKDFNSLCDWFIIFLLTGLRIYTGEYKAQGPTLCPTEGRALRGPRALYSPV